MSSRAINVNSALKYISNKSSIPLDVIKSWFNISPQDINKIINIQTALNIINRVMRLCFYASEISITIQEGFSFQNICSVKTFKSIYNKAIGDKIWNIVSNTSDIEYGSHYISLQQIDLETTVIGGGGGASGGGKTNFDGTGKLTIPAGAAGGESSIWVNGNKLVSAAGGTGGGGQTAQNGVRDAGNGSSGSSGATTTAIVSMELGDRIIFVPGYGGGGSGSGILRVTKNNSYSGTVPSPSKNKGSNGGQYGNATPRCAAGGGAGGYGYEATEGGDFGVTVTLLQGTGGSASNSGASDGRAGGASSDFSNDRKLGSFSAGASGGASGSAASGGSAGSSVGAGGGNGKTSGTNGYASGGGGGASGAISVINTVAYFNKVG